MSQVTEIRQHSGEKTDLAYLYTVHIIEEINTEVEGITPQNSAGLAKNLYWQKTLCIGARNEKVNALRSPSFLQEPLLKTSINGSHTFSFKIPRFYYDSKGNKVENSILEYLHNETRLLLQYYENITTAENFDKDREYQDKIVDLENLYTDSNTETIDPNIKTLVFVIKEITEDITGLFFEFECNDIYINELSKIGTQIVMDTELQNNIGSAQDLVNYVLEESNSDWTFEGMEKSSLRQGFYNYVEQPIVVLGSKLTDGRYSWAAFGLNDLTNAEPYISYYDLDSTLTSSIDLTQFIDEETGLFTGTGKGVINLTVPFLNLSSEEYEIPFGFQKTTYQSVQPSASNGFIKQIPKQIKKWNSTTSTGFVGDIVQVYYEYRANFLTPQEKTIYDKKGQQFVTPCRTSLNEIVYRKNGYLATDGGFENFVSNPNNFSNTNGWKFYNASGVEKEDGVKVVKTTSNITLGTAQNATVEYSALEFSSGAYEQTVQLENNFLMDTGKQSQGLISGEQFVVVVKLQTKSKTATNWTEGNTTGKTIMANVFGNNYLCSTPTLSQKTFDYANLSTNLISAGEQLYYDSNRNVYWGKIKNWHSYSQTAINNLIELKDKDGNLLDSTEIPPELIPKIKVMVSGGTSYDVRILDFEIYRYVEVTDSTGNPTWIEPEPISWLYLDGMTNKPTMSSNKLLSNYGTVPYYRYYDAPESPEKNVENEEHPERDTNILNKVLHYTCQRKLTDSNTKGITLWHLYVIVRQDYFQAVKNAKVDSWTSAADYEKKMKSAIGSAFNEIGGYVQRKKKYLLSSPKLLKDFLFTGAAPNNKNFSYNSGFYLTKFPEKDTIAPFLTYDIDFTERYEDGTEIKDGKEQPCIKYIPNAYTPEELKEMPAGTYLCYDSDFNDKNTFTERSYFSPKDSTNKDISSADDIIYRDISTKSLEQYPPIYTALKVGTVSASNSNAFNIIQNCCETFNCWAHFNVELVSTSLKAPDKFLMRKTITLYDQYYEDISQEFSFDYQKNINSIKRVVNSDDITTKTIVQPNNNEYGKNGFCTIQRSKYNLSGENYIYNFKYYIKKKMLDQVTLNRDMYGNNQVAIKPDSDMNSYLMSFKRYQMDCDECYDTFCEQLKLCINHPQNDKQQFGYIPTLNRINTEAKKVADTLSTALTNRDEAYASYLVAAEAVEAGEKLQKEAEEKLRNYVTTDGQTTMKKAVENVSNVSSGDVLKVMQSLKEEAERFATVVQNQKAIKASSKEVYDKYNKQYKYHLILADLLEKESQFLQKTFENKYHLYIQEGTWTSEDYYDDDKYYLDAASVAYTSGFPKITYTINVEPLINSSGEIVIGATHINDRGYRLEPGHKTYIQDTDYFKDENNQVFWEEVIISETEKYFDSPEKNTITVQNFRTQFEDLFQRIAATTANLEFAQGMYARAASLINPDGSLQPEAIEKTFTNVKSIDLTPDSSVTTGEQGIIVTNTKTPSEQVYIQGAGIRCTSDGGKTFLTAITGNGINANAITSGSIATDKIYIGDPNKPQMKWDSEGITCFSTIYNNGVNYLNYYKFVRLNDLGLYGINQVDISGKKPDTGYYLRSNVTASSNLTETDYTSGSASTSSNLLLNPQCIFYVGWEGFKFKSGSPSSMEGVYFDNNSGLIMRNSTGTAVLQIGAIGTNGTEKVYGFSILDGTTDKKPLLFNTSINSTGRIGLRGKLSILSSTSNSYDFSESDELGIFGYTNVETTDSLKNYHVTYLLEDPENSYVSSLGGETKINFGRQLIALKGGQSLILNQDYNQQYKDGLQIRYGYQTDKNTFKGTATFGLNYCKLEYREKQPGLMTTVVFPEGTCIEIKGYSNAGKDASTLSTKRWFQYGLRIAPAGILTAATDTGSATSAFTNFALRGFAPGVKLQPINCLSNIESPYLVFQGSISSDKRGYIMTEDNFICNELFANNLSIGNSVDFSKIETAVLTVKRINVDSIINKTTDEAIYISDITTGVLKAMRITVNGDENSWLRFYGNICFGDSTQQNSQIDFNNWDVINLKFKKEWWDSNYLWDGDMLNLGNGFTMQFTSSLVNWYNQSELILSMSKGSEGWKINFPT